jgi:putative ABC transport system substrate-binding protein
VNRRAFVRTFAGGLLGAPLAAEAQQARGMPRIGVLVLAPLSARPQQWEAFRQGLREHGYLPGQNILLEFRSADGKPERLAELAAELVQANMDVIVGSGTPPVQALQKATRTIPIVMANVGDPVGAGIVASSARPGGNITGLSLLATELSAKRLEILKAALPGLARIAVLGNPTNVSVQLKVKETASAARLLGLQFQSLEVRVPDDLETQIQAAARARADALVTADDQFLSSQRAQVVALAMRHRLPVASEFSEFAEAGSLRSYGPSLTDLARRTATYVDRILKGAKPGDLPIEQPTKFELVINLKTAKALGLTIPPSLLRRADQVIE